LARKFILRIKKVKESSTHAQFHYFLFCASCLFSLYDRNHLRNHCHEARLLCSKKGIETLKGRAHYHLDFYQGVQKRIGSDFNYRRTCHADHSGTRTAHNPPWHFFYGHTREKKIRAVFDPATRGTQVNQLDQKEGEQKAHPDPLIN
jgi:hypothetical protein